jgi:hypothetical protein
MGEELLQRGFVYLEVLRTKIADVVQHWPREEEEAISEPVYWYAETNGFEEGRNPYMSICVYPYQEERSQVEQERNRFGEEKSGFEDERNPYEDERNPYEQEKSSHKEERIGLEEERHGLEFHLEEEERNPYVSIYPYEQERSQLDEERNGEEVIRSPMTEDEGRNWMGNWTVNENDLPTQRSFMSFAVEPFEVVDENCDLDRIRIESQIECQKAQQSIVNLP